MAFMSSSDRTLQGFSLPSTSHSQVGDKAAKLAGGLSKLDETTEQVGGMKEVAQKKAVVVA